MLPSPHSTIGTIEMQPHSPQRSGFGDDSSLAKLLASFAQCATLSDGPPERGDRICFVASRRLSWHPRRGASLVLQANLNQLADDLQSEFEALDALLR